MPHTSTSKAATRFTVPRGMLAGFVIAALATVLIALVNFRTAQVRSHAVEAMDETTVTMRHLNLFVSSVKDAETGQRGYLLTGNDKPSPDGGNVWSKTTDPANGTVVVNPDGTLHSVTERTGIETYEGGIRCTSLTGEGTDDLPVEAPVSMNLWGFGKSFLDEADRRFAGWLRENLPKNPLKCEYFLPTVASELIDEGKAAVTVLKSTDKWYGVTYREDKPTVVAAIAQKTQEGLYPEDLWA